MGTPYSNDLRLRVPAAVDGGVPVRQVAALLRVSVSYTTRLFAVRPPAPQARGP
jgi:transposase